MRGSVSMSAGRWRGLTGVLTKLLRKVAGRATHRRRFATARHVEHLPALHEIIDGAVDLCMMTIIRLAHVRFNGGRGESGEHGAEPLFRRTAAVLMPRIVRAPWKRLAFDLPVCLEYSGSRTLELRAECGRIFSWNGRTGTFNSLSIVMSPTAAATTKPDVPERAGGVCCSQLACPEPAVHC